MTRAVLCISSSFEIESEATALVLHLWKSGKTSIEAAEAVCSRVHRLGAPRPPLSLAQAYAANVIGRHQDALYVARQQEAQRA